jgi:hypothetical protein
MTGRPRARSNALARAGVALLLLALLLVTGAACGAQNAAQRDPMKCERDPACAKARGSYSDCTQQCVDNPECVDRCRGAQVDRMGHP